MAVVDCVIIGAGPAGLTGGIYLARLRRNVIIMDGGPSRAELIPISHNYPGFPTGVSGVDLLKRLREQATSFGVTIKPGKVLSLKKENDKFVIGTDDDVIYAEKVLLTTGIEDKHPAIKDWEEHVCNGIIRLCPICDGYDAHEHRIAIISTPDCAIAHAEFMRTYSSSVSLYLSPSANISSEMCAALTASNIELIEGEIESIFVNNERPNIRCNGGDREYDSLYVMLGEARSTHLARDLGAEFTAEGSLKVDHHQATSIEGLFAAGDVVSSLHQISVAIGQAAIAATQIHNTLPKNYCR